MYYQAQNGLTSERFILKPSELRRFLYGIKESRIKFKYDYMEITVPILNKDLPLTFNLKEDREHIILTTHKHLPTPLDSSNEVYYYKNAIYLPSKKQIKNYAIIYEKLRVNGEIIYRKDISNYNNLISILSNISENINICESLRNFTSDLIKPEFLIYEENSKIYCDVYLSYGDKKINILNKNKSADAFFRDYKKEEKLIMKIEKNSFIKIKDRFLFIGKDQELFNIVSSRENSIQSLGTVILGKGLNDIKIYNSDSIYADLYDVDGYYDFACNIGDINGEELNNVLEAYRSNKNFYKTKRNGFIDFEDDSTRNFFSIIESLKVNEDSEYRNFKLEKCNAIALYANLKNRGVRFNKVSEEIKETENKLANINNKEIALPDNFKGTLKEYQIKGFNWLKTLSEVGLGGILADEMGLGKTIQIIAFMLSEQNKKTFIICPTSLIYNWKEELKKFAPSLRVLIIHGPERVTAIDSICEYDVILTTYGTVRIDLDCYSNIIFDYCIIDEGQNIKNDSAQNTRAIKQIKAKTRFALTGTPIENNLTELWSIFDFVMPGYLYSKQEFEEKFISTQTDNFENIKMLIKPFILRRTKKEVMSQLPDKIEKKILVEMTEYQKAIYSNYIKEVRSIMKNNKSRKIEIFSVLTKLRQICLDPSLVIEGYNGGSRKIEVAMELIKEHIDSGGKVLLFSQFTSALDKIGEGLKKEGVKFFHLDGRTKPKDRIKRVNDFNSSQVAGVFLISLKAGGTGLNLTSANLVIHFDPWWNPAVMDQATDRAHRIGQSNIVEVIKLVAKGTIEEKIVLLQEDKKELFDNILTGELQNSNLLSSLSNEDLMQLFDK